MKKLYTLSFEQVFASTYNFAVIVAAASAPVSTNKVIDPPPTEAVLSVDGYAANLPASVNPVKTEITFQIVNVFCRALFAIISSQKRGYDYFNWR